VTRLALSISTESPSVSDSLLDSHSASHLAARRSFARKNAPLEISECCKLSESFRDGGSPVRFFHRSLALFLSRSLSLSVMRAAKESTHSRNEDKMKLGLVDVIGRIGSSEICIQLGESAAISGCLPRNVGVNRESNLFVDLRWIHTTKRAAFQSRNYYRSVAARSSDSH